MSTVTVEKLKFGWVRRLPREDRPYLDRYSVREQKPKGGGGWRVYLHHIMSHDTELHNHPYRWSFALVLRGSYTERYFDREPALPPHADLDQLERFGFVKRRRIRWFNWIPASRYHQIEKLHGDVWTLFFAGPKLPSWGYWVRGRGHVPFLQRNAERGIGYQS